MRYNVRQVLSDCIERGARSAVLNNEDISDEYLITCIENEIWNQIDEYFTFDDD